jgi:hypothetical protein
LIEFLSKTVFDDLKNYSKQKRLKKERERINQQETFLDQTMSGE